MSRKIEGVLARWESDQHPYQTEEVKQLIAEVREALAAEQGRTACWGCAGTGSVLTRSLRTVRCPLCPGSRAEPEKENRDVLGGRYWEDIVDYPEPEATNARD